MREFQGTDESRGTFLPHPTLQHHSHYAGRYKEYTEVDSITYSPPSSSNEPMNHSMEVLPSLSETSFLPFTERVDGGGGGGHRGRGEVEGGAAQAPPTPFHHPSAATQVLGTTGLPPPQYKKIEDWHLKSDACIYQGSKEHSSTVVSVQGDLITTRSGSSYRLGKLDERVAEILSHASPGAFDPHNPLSPSTRALLLYAENIVYGKAAQPIQNLFAALQSVEEAIGIPGFRESVGPQFAAIRTVLSRLGVVHH